MEEIEIVFNKLEEHFLNIGKTDLHTLVQGIRSYYNRNKYLSAKQAETLRKFWERYKSSKEPSVSASAFIDSLKNPSEKTRQEKRKAMMAMLRDKNDKR